MALPELRTVRQIDPPLETSPTGMGRHGAEEDNGDRRSKRKGGDRGEIGIAWDTAWEGVRDWKKASSGRRKRLMYRVGE